MRNGKSNARGFVAIECAFVPLIASNALFVYTAVMNITCHSVNEPFRVAKIAGARLLKNDSLDALDAVVADYRDLANHAYVTSSQHSVAKKRSNMARWSFRAPVMCTRGRKMSSGSRDLGAYRGSSRWKSIDVRIASEATSATGMSLNSVRFATSRATSARRRSQSRRGRRRMDETDRH